MSASEVRTSLADHDCTALTDKSIVCPGDDARLSVSRSTDVASLPDARVEITVRNDADETFVGNVYDWRLYKHDGTTWRFLAPWVTPQPVRRLPPGTAYTFDVVGDTTSEDESDVISRGSELPVSPPGLGPGIYGFVNESFSFEGDDQPLAFGATFGFAGEGPPIQPTDDVEWVERDNGTVTVWKDTDMRDLDAFTVTFVDSADATLLAEHVRMLFPLRNTLSYAATEGVDTIQYVMGDAFVDRALSYVDAVTPGDASSYRFRDYRFEVGKTDP